MFTKKPLKVLFIALSFGYISPLGLWAQSDSGPEWYYSESETSDDETVEAEMLTDEVLEEKRTKLVRYATCGYGARPYGLEELVHSLELYPEILRTRDERGDTVLHLAAKNNHRTTFFKILGASKFGGDDNSVLEDLYDARNDDGYNVLDLAAINGNYQFFSSIAKRAKRKGILDKMDVVKALHLVAKNDHMRTFFKILGASKFWDDANSVLEDLYDARNDDGYNVLDLAAINGNYKSFFSIAKRAKRKGILDKMDVVKALHLAIKARKQGCAKLIRTFFRQEARGGFKLDLSLIDAEDSNGLTLIDQAKQSENPEKEAIIAYLKEEKIKHSSRINGERGAHSQRVVDLAGPEPTLNPEFDQALLDAAKAGDYNAVKKALRDGANPDAQDANGNTPLHWIAVNPEAEGGSGRFVDLILDADAALNVENNDGQTAVDIARGAENEGFVLAFYKRERSLAHSPSRGQGAPQVNSWTLIPSVPDPEQNNPVHSEDGDRQNALRLAAGRGDIATFKLLLNMAIINGVEDVAGVGEALLIAIEKCHEDNRYIVIIEYIFDKAREGSLNLGNLGNLDVGKVLHEAIRNLEEHRDWEDGNLQLVKLLFEIEEEGILELDSELLDARDEDGHTPLEHARNLGNQCLIKYLEERFDFSKRYQEALAQGHKILSPYQLQCNMVFEVIKNREPRLIELCFIESLSRSSKIASARDDDGNTIWHVALSAVEQDRLCLLDRFSRFPELKNLLCVENNNGHNVLHLAADMGDLALVQKVLDCAELRKVLDKIDISKALCIALEKVKEKGYDAPGHFDIIKFLFNKAKEERIVLGLDLLGIQYAAGMGQQSLIEYLRGLDTLHEPVQPVFEQWDAFTQDAPVQTHASTDSETDEDEPMEDLRAIQGASSYDNGPQIGLKRPELETRETPASKRQRTANTINEEVIIIDDSDSEDDEVMELYREAGQGGNYREEGIGEDRGNLPTMHPRDLVQALPQEITLLGAGTGEEVQEIPPFAHEVQAQQNRDQVLLREVREGNYERVQVALRAGANPDALDPGGNAALHLIAMNFATDDNVRILNLLIGAGADVYLENRMGRTAFDIADYLRNDAIAQALALVIARQPRVPVADAQVVTQDNAAAPSMMAQMFGQ